jgi:hypothetical protein
LLSRNSIITPGVRNGKVEQVGERATRLHTRGLLSKSELRQIRYLLKMRNAAEYKKGRRSGSGRFDPDEAEKMQSTIDSLATNIRESDERLAAKLKRVKLPT